MEAVAGKFDYIYEMVNIIKPGSAFGFAFHRTKMYNICGWINCVCLGEACYLL